MLRLLAKAGKRFAVKMKCIKEAHMFSDRAVPVISKCDQLKLPPKNNSGGDCWNPEIFKKKENLETFAE